MNLLHITCLAHSLHRVAEKIRDEFKNVDKLIARTKQVFLKAPQRIAIYREMFPDLKMVPKPTITRWGTWLDAVSFYWENFESVKTVFIFNILLFLLFLKVVDALNPKDASCISECQKCFNQEVWQDMAYIQSNFGNLSQSITKLEKQGLTIQEAMEIFVSVRNDMDFSMGDKADVIRQKFTDIVDKNKAIDTIVKLCQILSGKNMDLEIPPNLIPLYKYASLTSSDVERSFSIYKSILSDKRMSFTLDNLEKYLICVYNSKND